MVNFTPRPIYPWGKSPSNHCIEEARWSPEPVWVFWRRDKSLAGTAIRNLDRSVRSVVATMTALEVEE
jgi:hypothetical protein